MLQGIGVSSGLSIAQALLWKDPIAYDSLPLKTYDKELDAQRFETALANVLQKNKELVEHTTRRMGKEEATIFYAFCLILEDTECVAAPIHAFMQHKAYSAEYAVVLHFNNLANDMLALEDEYMRQRAEDFYSLQNQILSELLGHQPADITHFTHPTILVACTLSVSDIVNVDRSRLSGIICENGGYSSHASIIARTLKIPMVIGIEDICAKVDNGDNIVLDGKTGEVWLNPDLTTLAALRCRHESLVEKGKQEKLLHGIPTVCRDGRRIELSANVGQLMEIDAAIAADAEAIGMFRTELLHLNRSILPTEEEQFQYYLTALKKMGNKAITVRTLDIGDNPSRLLPEEKSGNNPALGYRGIRMSLGRPGLLRPQLRALLRASAYGVLRVVLPMVTYLHELETVKQAFESIKQELRREQIPFDENMPLGILIEVPAAALIADELAKQVDFFCIGINDLVQFLLAVDRGGQQVAPLYNLYHPAILRVIHMIASAAYTNAIACTLCGEMPNLAQFLPLLIGLGVNGFSLNPHDILGTRQVLNNCTYSTCKSFAEQALTATSTTEIATLLDDFATSKLH